MVTSLHESNNRTGPDRWISFIIYRYLIRFLSIHRNIWVQTIERIMLLFPLSIYSCLDGTWLGNSDLRLGSTRGRTVRLDLFDEVQPFRYLAFGGNEDQRRSAGRDLNLPNTTWAPSSQEVVTVVMKNWEPLVFFPAFAMDRIPGFVCLSWKFSSARNNRSETIAYYEITIRRAINAPYAPANFSP
jgi:hypothetical protein